MYNITIYYSIFAAATATTAHFFFAPWHRRCGALTASLPSSRAHHENPCPPAGTPLSSCSRTWRRTPAATPSWRSTTASASSATCWGARPLPAGMRLAVETKPNRTRKPLTNWASFAGGKSWFPTNSCHKYPTIIINHPQFGNFPESWISEQQMFTNFKISSHYKRLPLKMAFLSSLISLESENKHGQEVMIIPLRPSLSATLSAMHSSLLSPLSITNSLSLSHCSIIIIVHIISSPALLAGEKVSQIGKRVVGVGQAVILHWPGCWRKITDKLRFRHCRSKIQRHLAFQTWPMAENGP